MHFQSIILKMSSPPMIKQRLSLSRKWPTNERFDVCSSKELETASKKPSLRIQLQLLTGH